jgi:hypothetical protein
MSSRTDWYQVAQKLGSIVGDIIAGELTPSAGAIVEVLDVQAAAAARTAQTYHDNIPQNAVNIIRRELAARGGTCKATTTRETDGERLTIVCMLPIGHEGAHINAESPLRRIRWSDSMIGHVTEQVQHVSAREAEL